MFKKLLLRRQRRSSDLANCSANTKQPSSRSEQPMDKLIYRFSFDDEEAEPEPPPPPLSTIPTTPIPSPKHDPTSPESCNHDLVTILVEARESHPAAFTLPSSLLRWHSAAFRRLLALAPAERDLLATPPFSAHKGTLFLPKVNTSHFVDFAWWLLSTSTSPHQQQEQNGPSILRWPRENVPYALLSAADSLAAALDLGIKLESTTYQAAALAELSIILPLLDRPGLLIQPLSAATTGWEAAAPPYSSHPPSLASKMFLRQDEKGMSGREARSGKARIRRGSWLSALLGGGMVMESSARGMAKRKDRGGTSFVTCVMQVIGREGERVYE